jgi:hypothetical protein
LRSGFLDTGLSYRLEHSTHRRGQLVHRLAQDLLGQLVRQRDVGQFPEEEKRIVKALLEGMILKHEATRWANA